MDDEIIEQHAIKIAVIGPEQVGKSSIINSLCDVQFDSEIKSTTCYKVDQIIIENTVVNFWDCGSYHFQSYEYVKKAFYRGSLFVLLVFDATDKKSIEFQIEDWLNECEHFNIYQTIIIINKIDGVDDADMNTKTISIGPEQEEKSIQMTKQNIASKQDYESDIRRIVERFQKKVFFGSAKQATYKNFIIQLIKDNQQNLMDSKKFEMDRNLRRPNLESQIRNTIPITQSIQEPLQKTKCIIF